MPAHDFEGNSKRAEEYFFNDKSISDINKEYVRKFADQYNKKPSTRTIFFHYITFLARDVPDIKVAMQDRDLINKLFKKYRTEQPKSYLGFIIKESLVFVRWLNDDEKPKGFKDIDNISKKDQKRDLKPSDMLTWEDGKKLASLTTSQQFKAIILTQLDAGFRPSEFIDLNYGDVDIKKDVIVFNVSKEHKTGARSVICQRSAPEFLRWYYSHPTKKANDPLWILENRSKKAENYTIKRYNYSSLWCRMKLLGENAKIKKPMDFYNLRHSSCVLDKLDNLPVELAAQRHGHSVKYFTEVYGRLSVDDMINRTRLHYGQIPEKEKLKQNIICERCKSINDADAEYCHLCSSPLSLKKALEEKQKQEESVINAVIARLQGRKLK